MSSMRRTDRLTRQLETQREMQYRQQRDMAADAKWQQSRTDEQNRYKADMAFRTEQADRVEARWRDRAGLCRKIGPEYAAKFRQKRF